MAEVKKEEVKKEEVDPVVKANYEKLAPVLQKFALTCCNGSNAEVFKAVHEFTVFFAHRFTPLATDEEVDKK